jgi:hypothetical protein
MQSQSGKEEETCAIRAGAAERNNDAATGKEFGGRENLSPIFFFRDFSGNGYSSGTKMKGRQGDMIRDGEPFRGFTNLTNGEFHRGKENR